MTGVLVITLMLLFFLTRFTVAAASPDSFDSYGHLSFIKNIKEQKTGITGSIITNVVSPKPFTHPFLFHWLLAMLPWSFLTKRSKWINPLIELIFIWVVIYILYQKIPIDLALKLSIFYVMTPSMFTSLSSGPRVSSFTPRIISEIALNVYFLIFVLFEHKFELLFVISILCIVITLLSSKFGLQAALFISIATAVLGQTIYPIYVFIIALLVSLVIFRKSVLKIWREQFVHLYWYFRQNILGKMSVSRRNSVTKIVQAFKKYSGWKGLFSGIYHLTVKNSYTSTVIKSPLIVVSVLLIFFSPEKYDDASVVIGGALIIYFLTNLNWFLFLGEAERYLNHVIIVSYVYAVLNIPQIWIDKIFIFLVAYGSLYLLAEVIYLKILGKKAQKIDQESELVIDFLNNEKIGLNVLCSPFHAVGVYRILVKTIHSPFYVYTCNEKFKQDWSEKYFSDYPRFNFDKLSVLSQDHPVDVIICDKSTLNSFENLGEILSAKGYLDRMPALLYFKVYSKNGI